MPYIFCAISVEAFEQAGEVKFSNIAVDDCLESKKMTEYLLDLGHRRIAFITENLDETIGRSRMEGYWSAYVERGLEVPEDLICYVQEDVDHYSMENGYLTTKKLLQSKREVAAIYAAADSLAIGACRAVLEAGLRIPEDISVAGYDGMEIGEYYNPKLTTIKQPVEEMAKEAIQLLFDVIAGLKEHQQIIFSAELVERESTARLHGN